jgi:hypothetical protein
VNEPRYVVQVRISIWPEAKHSADTFGGQRSGDPFALVESEPFQTRTGARFLAGKILSEIRRISEAESAVEREHQEKSPDG